MEIALAMRVIISKYVGIYVQYLILGCRQKLLVVIVVVFCFFSASNDADCARVVQKTGIESNWL